MKAIKLTLLVALASLLFPSCGGHTATSYNKVDTIALAPCPTFVADSAFQYIKDQCAFGPRITGSKESLKCAQYIEEKFQQFGAKVSTHESYVVIYDGTRLLCRNIIASLNPDNPNRILLCAHWDSRPWADNDPNPKNHKKPVLAANDGASGVAVMLELCRIMQQHPIHTGIDFVCFDAEDMGTPRWAEDDINHEDTWCLGSRNWAQWAANEKNYTARFGILFDMVGGRGNTFAREMISMQYAAPVVDLLWHLAHQIGYGHYFPMKDGGFLIDDHVNVNKICRIPCLDIVPYYEDGPSSFGPTWHTVDDTLENIDPNVLEAVGQSVAQLLYNDDAE
ncbi:MAG: M28 family peptidase [Bacteroidaceae bacterium]|nr:M28 family peptidase [Bacteroidaceae bacterium]